MNLGESVPLHRVSRDPGRDFSCQRPELIGTAAGKSKCDAGQKARKKFPDR